MTSMESGLDTVFTIGTTAGDMSTSHQGDDFLDSLFPELPAGTRASILGGNTGRNLRASDGASSVGNIVDGVVNNMTFNESTMNVNYIPRPPRDLGAMLAGSMDFNFAPVTTPDFNIGNVPAEQSPLQPLDGYGQAPTFYQTDPFSHTNTPIYTYHPQMQPASDWGNTPADPHLPAFDPTISTVPTPQAVQRLSRGPISQPDRPLPPGRVKGGRAKQPPAYSHASRSNHPEAPQRAETWTGLQAVMQIVSDCKRNGKAKAKTERELAKTEQPRKKTKRKIEAGGDDDKENLPPQKKYTGGMNILGSDQEEHEISVPDAPTESEIAAGPPTAINPSRHVAEPTPEAAQPTTSWEESPPNEELFARWCIDPYEKE